MSRLPPILILVVLAACGAGRLAAQTAGQTKLPLDLNSCVLCHCTPETWAGKEQQFYIDKAGLADDAHFQAGVTCADCHGGNHFALDEDDAHVDKTAESEPGLTGFRATLDDIQAACDSCHQEQRNAVTGGMHADAAAPGPLSCQQCHGEIKHALYPRDDRRSGVFLNNQVELCGGCHDEDRDTYLQSVHGQGMVRSGLSVTAVCADCHGPHKVLPVSDEASPLHPTNVADTCAKCHRFIEQRLRKSVHGRGAGPGGATEEPAPGPQQNGSENRKPTCTDCHSGHNLSRPHTAQFRLGLSDRCGDCHTEPSEGYRQSLHGALTQLGHQQAAECSDCHGAHDILGMDDPNSRLAKGENRLATCKKCHQYAVANFSNFQPHANHHDVENYPLLHYVHLAMELLIGGVFAFFGVHTILWFLRSMIHYRRHGRPQRLEKQQVAYVRFESIHRFLHAIMATSFLGLALTGLPLKYSNQPWAQSLARILGGFESTGAWHRICALLTIFYFAAHLLWLLRATFRARSRGEKWLALVFGPDSPVPRPRDLLDLIAMGRWFFGLGPKPVFERWTYWEKFDYWAVFWGVGIIGSTGMMLWFPNLFCLILPGELLSVAGVIHSEEALLATSFIFAIHFFGTHLRPEKFPMDMTVLSGLVTEEELREERPEFLERMRAAGRLNELKAPVPARHVLRWISAAGFLALAVGLGLLVGILLAMFGGH